MCKLSITSVNLTKALNAIKQKPISGGSHQTLHVASLGCALLSRLRPPAFIPPPHPAPPSRPAPPSLPSASPCPALQLAFAPPSPPRSPPPFSQKGHASLYTGIPVVEGCWRDLIAGYEFSKGRITFKGMRCACVCVDLIQVKERIKKKEKKEGEA